VAFCYKRSASIYPVYAVSLLISLVQHYNLGLLTSLRPNALLAQLFLFQVPTPYTLHPTPYTLHPTPYALDPKP
jgi:hypothetical protein